MDSYISVIEAIKHASYFYKRKPKIEWLSATKYEKNPSSIKELKKFDGIIIPGGFGTRGVRGKIMAVEYCRKNKIPFLGLCLGMQMATIEFARNVCGIENACSAESKNCKEAIIDVMEEQKHLIKDKNYGGTMRLGAYDCEIKPGTAAFKAYKGKGKEPLLISERHRHRYEVNNKYRDVLEKNGLVIAGINPKRDLVEIIEVKDHPFFVASQFHPEFKSRPLRPHPLFKGLIKASIK